MAKNINVNRNVVDPYYRYKMPRIEAKVEGKGNGIKTVIANMAEVAKALERPPMYPTKYFGCELGAQTNFDSKNERYIVNGDHDANKLQDLLDGFIKKFVLCTNCENPETVYSIKKNNITSKCKACGHTFPIDPRHKLSTYIIKNPPPSACTDDDNNSSKKENTSPTEERSPSAFDYNNAIVPQITEVDNDDWAPEDDTEVENVSSSIQKLILSKDLDKPIGDRLDMLYDFMEQAKKKGTLATSGKAILNEAERLDIKTKVPPLLCDLIFDQNILEQIPEYANLINLFVKDDKKAQRYLLGGIEQVIAKYKDDLIKKSAHILKMIYDEDLCEEEVILAWGAKPSGKHVKKEISKEILAKCEKVLKWLEEAEEESSSEEESDDDVEFDDRARNIGTVLVNGKSATVAPVKITHEGEEINIDDI